MLKSFFFVNFFSKFQFFFYRNSKKFVLGSPEQMTCELALDLLQLRSLDGLVKSFKQILKFKFLNFTNLSSIVCSNFTNFIFGVNELKNVLFESIRSIHQLEMAYRAATDHASSSGSSHIRLIESAFQYLLMKKMFCAAFGQKII